MNSTTENKIIELESKITLLLNKNNSSNCTVHFEYSTTHEFDDAPVLPNTNVAYITTHNPIHNTSFLFGKFYGGDDESALESALSYIEKNIQTQYTYTVEWKQNGFDGTHTSYFAGENMMDVFKKFYFGKKYTDYLIYSIKTNPVA